MTPHSPEFTIDAIILAGGGGRRMGGVDKPALTVGGISLLQRAIDATAVARRIVVVGPHRDDLRPDIVQVRESPPGSGPVAAIAAGLSALAIGGSAEVIMVLASDLPFVDEGSVDTVLSELLSHPAVFAADDSGRTQYLFGAWHAGELRRRIAGLSDTANKSARSIVPDDHAVVKIPNIGDCDTLGDLAAARESAAADIPDEPTPTADEARADIRRHISPLPTRSVPLAGSFGSTLAQPIFAATPLPPVDISAMDGYAVAGDGPWTIHSEIVYAGTTLDETLGTGRAIRIATGAHVPKGATSTVRDEHVVRDGATLRLRDGVLTRDDTRRAGEDWSAGVELVAAGREVSAAVVSVALSGEVRELTVRGPVSARVVLSGSEIRSEGPLTRGQTRDSVGPVFTHYLATCGIALVDTVYLQDSPGAFEDLLAQSTTADVVIVVGATGGGAADQLRTALVRADAKVIVRRTQIRPGGSQITAVLPSGTVVLGLPGNPLAAVCTLMLTGPAIVDALTCRTPRAPMMGLLTGEHSATSSVARLVPVKLDGTHWRVQEHVRTAHLLHLVDSDALALIPAEFNPGVPVELLLLPR
ncbi:NTP transferase domain-containing protein [Rhodococcus sp. G-MC3]|uniref:NTP transferase domain-containing protein n=1 Tax=Rhodococcus sp. G-MC3 TaxID=3046209 RepID=UPI0024BB360F|nr:NTP transferase domain-containing protein [Rhodococcus sp. G-MC3]MDJ0395217.1 NTP transferase domain-containing protein [Rhodococcus sp. G-MC3]